MSWNILRYDGHFRQLVGHHSRFNSWSSPQKSWPSQSELNKEAEKSAKLLQISVPENKIKKKVKGVRDGIFPPSKKKVVKATCHIIELCLL